MLYFGWIGHSPDPPSHWDLRKRGWHLCAGHPFGADTARAECRHVLIVDAAPLSATQRIDLAEADRPAWRLLLLGVESPPERADLLARGCAEALPAAIGLAELASRARRIDDMFSRLPRWRMVGPLVLDLFHRDARLGTRWMALHPREFGMLWRLADQPRGRVTRAQFLRDVWRISHDPQTNSVEVHMSRLRSKLAGAGCGGLVCTLPEGGYILVEDESCASPFLLAPHHGGADRLDAYLRLLDFAPLRAGQSHDR